MHHPNRQESVDAAIESLMKRLPPEVADRIHQKYEQDRTKFLGWVESNIPSKEPAYWAKPSCTKCYGRGILGTLFTPTGEKVVPACSCTGKSYSKWLITARQQYMKEQGHEKTAG